MKTERTLKFERRQGSGRIKSLNFEIDQKIIDPARENQFISILEIASILKKEFSTTSSYRTIYNILKENSYSYVSSQLAPKTDEEIKKSKIVQKKSDRDWKNVIFIDEWTFYLKPPRYIIRW